MLERVGAGVQAGSRLGPPNVDPTFSFFSKAQDGLQRFWLVRASAQTPEEVGPREAGGSPSLPRFFPPGRSPDVKNKMYRIIEEMILLRVLRWRERPRLEDQNVSAG